jgi:hypothetical protein
MLDHALVSSRGRVCSSRPMSKTVVGRSSGHFKGNPTGRAIPPRPTSRLSLEFLPAGRWPGDTCGPERQQRGENPCRGLPEGRCPTESVSSR